jgi:hypothetical protein
MHKFNTEYVISDMYYSVPLSIMNEAFVIIVLKSLSLLIARAHWSKIKWLKEWSWDHSLFRCNTRIRLWRAFKSRYVDKWIYLVHTVHLKKVTNVSLFSIVWTLLLVRDEYITRCNTFHTFLLYIICYVKRSSKYRNKKQRGRIHMFFTVK